MGSPDSDVLGQMVPPTYCRALIYSGNPGVPDEHGGGGHTTWQYDALGRQIREDVAGVPGHRSWNYQGLASYYSDRDNVIHTTVVEPALGEVNITAFRDDLSYMSTSRYASNGALVERTDELTRTTGPSSTEVVYESIFTYDQQLADKNILSTMGLRFGDDFLDHETLTTLDADGRLDSKAFSFQGGNASPTQLWNDDFEFGTIQRGQASLMSFGRG